MNAIIWQCKSFDELTNLELYKILQLRIEIFAVEQNVVYQDCDNKDLQSYHLMGWLNNQLIAYSRLLPPGVAYNGSASIGRVVTASSIRGQHIGKQLMEKSIRHIYNLFGNISITISAQHYLEKFYETYSFVAIGDTYLEDSIPHIKMEKGT